MLIYDDKVAYDRLGDEWFVIPWYFYQWITSKRGVVLVWTLKILREYNMILWM